MMATILEIYLVLDEKSGFKSTNDLKECYFCHFQGFCFLSLAHFRTVGIGLELQGFKGHKLSTFQEHFQKNHFNRNF